MAVNLEAALDEPVGKAWW